MGSMRNGCGDDLFVLFSAYGAFVKGFDHERWEQYPVKDAYATVSACFSEAVQEPAFSPEQVTFCCWFSNEVEKWNYAEIPPLDPDENGSNEMLDILGGDPDKYLTFAQEYYEIEVSADSVAAVFNHTSMTIALAQSLNPEIEFKSLLEDLAQISYPIAS